MKTIYVVNYREKQKTIDSEYVYPVQKYFEEKEHAVIFLKVLLDEQATAYITEDKLYEKSDSLVSY